jgi:general secretion pathway protein D
MALHFQQSPKRAIKLAIIAGGISVISSCAVAPVDPQFEASGYKPLPIHSSALQLASTIPDEKLTTASRQLAAEGIRALDKQEYVKANDLFNLALKTDINNSYIHFLNGLTYHFRGLNGEATLYALAQQGYNLAIQFDGSNAIARRYLGLLYMDRRDYVAAQMQFMDAALYIKDDPDLLYDLATASYYAKDSKTAYAAMNGLLALTKGQLSQKNLRALSITAAAAGDDAAARHFLTKLEAMQMQSGQHGFVSERVRNWQDAYSSNAVKASLLPLNSGSLNGAGDALDSVTGNISGHTVAYQAPPDDYTSNSYDAPPSDFNASSSYDPNSYNTDTGLDGDKQSSAFYQTDMVMLDVTIIATEEDNNDTFGVNLLDGLRIQFGNQLGTPAFSKQTSRTNDLVNPLFDTQTKTLSRLIQVPAISYTLNIANAQDRRNEVLARPSLVALGGQTSTFFSGTEVVGAAVSTGQGGSVQVNKEAGVKLSLTPEFLPDGLIKLQVSAERTFLTNPNSNVLFDFRLDTSKTLVDANVVMKFGETLVLSGLSERNTEVDNSGVPGLRDVPLVQYLFSQKTTRDFHKSVVILVTPRRPSYTNRDTVDIEKERATFSDFERAQSEFEDKYKLWFKPVPNFAQAIATLEYSPIYREFRSGDLQLESWISRASHGGRLRSALDFLYF